MSKFFRKNNLERTMSLYYKRIMYDSLLRRSEPRHVINFNDAEKFLYGRVDTYYVPMVIKNQSLLRQLPTNASNAASRLSVFNFVEEAFRQLRSRFKMATLNGQVDPNDPIFGSLTPTKAYESPHVRYKKHIKVYSQQIAKQLIDRNIKILNFSQFIDEMIPIILKKEILAKFPFTKTAYIKSRLCPISCTGLAIEIADFDHSNDEQKYEKFIQNPNWRFYVNACNQFGFMIDRNAPWRIIADIDSAGMKAVASHYVGADAPSLNTKALMSAYYRNPYVEYFEDQFVEILLNIYNKARKSFYLEPKECNGNTVTQREDSIVYSVEDLQSEFSEEYFLKLYFTIRIAEEEIPLSENEANMLIYDVMKLYKGPQSYVRPLRVFERIINKTFDYDGSLSYTTNALSLLEEIKRADEAQLQVDSSKMGSGETGRGDGGGY